MLKLYTPNEPMTLDGFKSYSDTKVEDLLIVYRAYGGTSKRIGAFFFTPQIAGSPRLNWTTELLENELNVVLWGNELRRLAKFQLYAQTPYRIGPIAHDKYQGEREKNEEGEDILCFDQYKYFKNSNLFYQVMVLSEGPIELCWHQYMTLLDDVPINSSRLDRRVAHA